MKEDIDEPGEMERRGMERISLKNSDNGHAIAKCRRE